MIPIFSICHTSARPKGWQASAKQWLEFADDPELIEYILCIDARWGFTEEPEPPIDSPADWKVCWNRKRMSCVDGWNETARHATGHLLIMNADDFYPPPHWDSSFLKVVRNVRGVAKWGNKDFVLQISQALADGNSSDMLNTAILSRARYERLGYVYYPEYEGMFADDDYSEHAWMDNVVIDARHMVFEHRHPTTTPGVEWDDAYRYENRKESYYAGRTILERRRKDRFEK
jgi:hypothetical protein